jgi:hypothetical protein
MAERPGKRIRSCTISDLEYMTDQGLDEIMLIATFILKG